MNLSQRSQLSPLYLMAFFTEAQALSRQGRDVSHLTVGQPGEGAPKEAVARAMQRMEQGHGYTPTAGIPELRDRIERHYAEMYGLKIPRERIIVTIGASAAFVLSMLCAFDPGDEVAITMPYYPAYPNIMRALGLTPVLLRGDAESHFQPTAAMIEALPKKPKGLVLASPSNPSGTVIPRAEFEKLVAVCKKHKILLISDEIYHGITYGEPATSALELTDDVIVINSFSKYFRMPGWRLGWVVLPEGWSETFERLAESFFLSPPHFSQYVGLEVFECKPDLEAAVALYRRNRALLLDALPKLGITRLAPADGAFYIYADVGDFTNDSGDFARSMLYEAGIATIPGRDFDPEEGNRFLRFSFCGSEATVQQAVEKLENWLGKTKAIA